MIDQSFEVGSYYEFTAFSKPDWDEAIIKSFKKYPKQQCIKIFENEGEGYKRIQFKHLKPAYCFIDIDFKLHSTQKRKLDDYNFKDFDEVDF